MGFNEMLKQLTLHPSKPAMKDRMASDSSRSIFSQRPLPREVIKLRSEIETVGRVRISPLEGALHRLLQHTGELVAKIEARAGGEHRAGFRKSVLFSPRAFVRILPLEPFDLRFLPR